MRGLAFIFMVLLLPSMAARAAPLSEQPILADQVATKSLPPIAERVPLSPRILDIYGPDLSPGKYGGTLRMLMGDQRDIRMMTVYGYTRLVVFSQTLELEPDILDHFDVQEGRIFTLTLRKGHKWSDGHAFSAEDFRYYWEDVANNPRLSPGGPPQSLIVEGKPARFEVLDEQTVRYSWDRPNPLFLPALAAAQPLYIYLPAHYLKNFHERYADAADLQKRVKALRIKDWGALHERVSRQYRPENPDLPTLDPWRNTTPLPAEQFIFVRNPFYHRIDQNGLQLPYIDKVIMSIGTGSLIPAKTGAGESDLQARYLRFDDYTLLKDAEKRQNFDVRLWKRSEGAYFSLLPNMNAMDPGWRDLMRDVRFRRALSIGINRRDINRIIFFGLGHESSNTALPESPLFEKEMASAWTQFDPAAAGRLLDSMGLERRDGDGVRLLPDGRRLEFTIETAGESSEETDVLDLVAHDLINIGVKIFARSTQRDAFRRRVTSGQTVMSVWPGMDNALVGPDMEPSPLAPVNGQQYQWPRWGQNYESGGHEGEAPQLPEVKELLNLYNGWRVSQSSTERAEIWKKMLKINADQVFTIGLVNETSQPVVVSKFLRNVPKVGLYGFEPGAFFGIYRPDTFWFDKPGANGP